MESKYMVIISFDAVSSEDLSFLEGLPNFKYIMERGATIRDVHSIYPTLTYPAHATIVTGKYPKHHKIIDNTIFKMGDSNPDWYWYRKYIKGTTLFDLAKEKGLKTCSIFWPVTAGANIDYNMPEIFPVKKYQNQIMMSAKAGSIKYQLDINKRFGAIRDGIKEPALDNFTLEAAKYTIEKYKPNLMLIHFIDVDTNKHLYGCKNEIVKEALKRHDNRLGEIINSLKKAGIFEETTLVALGDHSQIDVSKIIKINKLLYENGLIDLKENRVVGYRAIAKSLDGSAYIYLKNPKDVLTLNTVRNLIESFRENNSHSIEYILNEEEIRRRGASKKASLMLEAGRGFYFVDDLEGEVIEEVKEEDIGVVPHRYRAIHGYSPIKTNYGTFFIGSGVGFKEGISLNKGKLINHAPTLAKILGINLGEVDGKVVEEILS